MAPFGHWAKILPHQGTTRRKSIMGKVRRKRESVLAKSSSE